MLLTQKLKSYYNTESGRSMIEMLGVLAIVGVLSIAGIAGYSYAIEKHKANNLLYELTVRKDTLIAQAVQGNELDLSEFDEVVDTFEITLDSYDPDPTKYVALYVENIPETVCKNIFHTEHNAYAVYNSGSLIKNQSNCLDNNDLTFVYSMDGVKLSDSGDGHETADPADCLDICSGDSTTDSCPANFVTRETAESVCGVVCHKCLNDLCPNGTKKSCGSGYHASYATSTEAGSDCYTCIIQGPSDQDPDQY